MRFLAKCYNEDCLRDSDNWIEFDKAAYGFVNANVRNQVHFELQVPTTWDETSTLNRAEPPGQLVPMSQLMQSMPDHPAVQYMVRERRYTRQLFDHYEISYCISVSQDRFSTAHNRIIFPIKRQGELVGWQARDVNFCARPILASFRASS